ncbi:MULTISPECIES: lytic transglycosylase domain-containing protein [Actinomadura]|uniref:Lytic transglycosylase domain-containing protein n=1 Tax=Actinomadura yumaensis TaxID=111807 RepID=A0ABW2CSK3_9ACTN|nr:lytic transglycosylase domain-containing protein [Actinomadura sp. J1-007]MWK37653.1 transglycosylase SLT domain-containing protein [Actinomadura sp. J1-007]
MVVAPPSPPTPGRRPKPEKKARKARPARAGAAPAKAPAAGRRRRTVAVLVTAVVVLLLGSLSAGVYTVSRSGDSKGGDKGGQRADPPNGGPGGPVTNVSDGAQVAPLRRVVPPDVLAVGTGPIDQRKIDKLSRLRKVKDVIAVAGGAVQLQGRQVNAFAVDPSSFRSWTPPGTATKTELWSALAAERFVVSTEAAEKLQLAEGTQYPVVGKTVPNLLMGGSGALGLPGIDMLVSRKAGDGMGLFPNVAVLVNAPGVEPGKLGKAVGKALGGRVKIVNLHERKYQPPSGGGRSGGYLDLYKRAATSCRGLSWTVLAAIGQVESDHGRNAGRSSAGALGPMQFMPATWKSYGVDGDGDGKADIMNPYDAIPGAAKYLCANGAGQGGQQLYRAIWHYNHADWYVQKVLNLARAYASAY